VNRVERTALVSVVINVFLVFLKVVLAALSGSLALVADAWHSASDIVASGLVWAGAHLSRREGRRNLALVENIVGLVIGLLILWAAFGIFRRISVASGAPIGRLPLAIGGALVAALVSYYAAQYKLHVGRETGSLSLMADGYHSRMDTLTTGAVVVGLMGHAIGIELDRIAAAVVAIFVVESAIVILAAAVGGLREGTAAVTTPFAKVADTEPVRAVRGFLERHGVVACWRRLRQSAGRSEWRRRAVAAAVIIVVALWALSSVYAVGPGRAAVVTRWGRAHGNPAGPGLHLRAPWPIDRVSVVELSKVRRIEIGYRTREVARSVTDIAAEFYATLWESRHEAGTYEKLPEEALRLTGDENIVDMNIVVLYQVSDPQAYIFNVANTEDLVRFVTESVTSATIGVLSIEDVLTIRRDSLDETLRAEVQTILDAAGAGVHVIGAKLQDMHPPLEVVPAFRDVASAREDRNRIVNEALAYTNDIVPKARGDAVRLLDEAKGYRAERVDHAHGDGARILAMADEHGKARSVTETRLYLETMESLLQNVEKFIVSSDVELTGYDIRVFDRELSPGAAIE
jgi:membrane protease subunit HflK